MKHFKNYNITLSLMLIIYILYKFYINLIWNYIKYKNLEKFIKNLKIKSIS